MTMMMGLGLMELVIIFVILAMLVAPIMIVVIVVMVASSNKATQSSNPNLMPCPNCQSMVSIHAASCPKCGSPLKPTHDA